jgi:ABC-type multidrug transport system fused ATPase/permease subunit
MYEIRPRDFSAGFVIIFSLSLIVLVGLGAFAIVSGGLATLKDYTNTKDGMSAIVALIPTIVVLAAVLPLIATWIGGVIAYSFALSNFTLALNAANRMTATRSSASEPVAADVMIDRKLFTEITLGAAQEAKTITIKKTLGMFGPEVWRIPVLDDDGVLQYIVHEHAVHSFCIKITYGHSPDRTLSNTTLQNLIDDAEFSKRLRRYVFVSPSDTLSVVKEKMAAERCLDAFVTQSGSSRTPVLGWVTDTILAGLPHDSK